MDPITGLPSAHREGVTTESHDWTLVKAVDLVANQDVIVIDGDTPIEESCEILIKNNLSSAPVYDSSTKSYVGMFDWADVMTYLLIVLKKKDAFELEKKSKEELSDEFRKLLRLALQCQPIPVKLASDISNKNPFYSVLPETSLFQVTELFGSGTHRVAVMDANNHLKGILTQSNVVSYLYDNARQFPEIEKVLTKTIEELGIGKSDVISVNSDSFVLDALKIMRENSLSSTAVVNSGGVLCGNISMSDIKYILGSYRHSLLWRTCQQFISHVRSRQGIDDGQDRYPVFDVRLSSTLGHVVAKLMATRAHRVWVVNETTNAIGVVSLTDVLSIFARQAGGTAEPSRKRLSDSSNPKSSE
ncbi:3654_t:CDS:10 [Paraglomus occultum]|uniref:3654_t:CDS:1 n=1 Tax=Paraglomus occultum TaxID=144539 RepID=A0A9N8ZCI8_9GLOM|nr:3654_t:CDS:10 [Paraglomus occultum]